MQIAEPRPPYITFEVHAEEDRTATIETGHYVSKDVTYVYITPQGSKDRLPRQVDEWFQNLEQQVLQDRFPREWLARFREQYKAWKEGQELPLQGTSVKQWPAASPAQVSTLLAANIRTVEDLASANEEALNRLGMGGRALKQRAVEWVRASQDTGKLAEELAALKQENQDLKATNASLAKGMDELKKQVEALAVKKL